ncbi:MAG TPA: AMP-binding protein [Negativicutes bacterium]|nr:AMP-binding protein [Negativicutes bacterium]
MKGFLRSPLDAWAAYKTGAGSSGLSREQLDRYQLNKLRATIRLAYTASPFYGELLKGIAETGLGSLADLRRYPFTTDEDVRRCGPRFLCVSQSDISRVVTLDSSGTTGPAKRLYFTPDDQEATVGFFRSGMASLTAPRDRVLILLPGERPGGVGDLLRTALKQSGAVPIPHGAVGDMTAALDAMAREQVDSLVSTPSQVLALARWAKGSGREFALKSVLLSTDHVPRAVVRELKRLWGCDVFEHYGMTEMGLGGGTDCAAHAGYHLHEADFYFEVVDPSTGDLVPAGEEGEVVVTTLTRRGMPLIRYRTGDISRFISEPCPCGSALKRLAPITGRVDGCIALDGYDRFTLADLDEALFAVRNVLGFTAAVDSFRSPRKLTVSVLTAEQTSGDDEQEFYGAIDTVPAIRRARRAGGLKVAVRTEPCRGNLALNRGKRTIVELNGADGD